MSNIIRHFLDTGCLVFALCVNLGATQPSHWTVSTQEEFLAGELKGVSVTGDGLLLLAPAFEPVMDTQEAFVYAAVFDRRGSLYLGTGNRGKVFKIPATGQGAEWARLEEAGVHALAVDSSNRLCAGTSPDGKVYRLNDAGQAQILFDPEEKYIWALAVDSQDNLFVATGPRGIIYRLNPKGESSIFYDSKETHIVTLEWSPDGDLLAGSAPSGLVYRITAAGKAFVVFDSDLEEVKSIAVDRYGMIYAAALAGAPSADDKAAGIGPASAKISAAEDQAGKGSEDTLKVAGSEKGKRLEIYRIDKENRVETIYSSNEGLAFDLLVRPDGSLLVATGIKGRIVSVDPRRFATFLVQSGEEQVTQLVEQGGRIYAATSNLGKVFQLGGKPSQAGVYESKILDAETTASWGLIRWRLRYPAATPVRVLTRSGNTASADQTWSDWSGPYSEPQGSPIQSAPARFLQWKVEFPDTTSTALATSPANAVEAVTVSYLQRNMPPQLTAITLHAPGLAFAVYPAVNPGGGAPPGGPDGAHLRSLPRSVRELDKPAATAPPRKIYVPGARSVSWTAVDPNRDDLIYAVSIRAQEDESWKLLDAEITETHYTLDGASYPDGVYFFRIVASDRPSNPPSAALDSQLISKAFIISNTSPVVELSRPQVQGSRATIEFTTRTKVSTVHQAEYTVDNVTWSIVFPVDGIADNNVEQYRLTLDNLSRGDHIVSIRVVDSVGNLGTGKVAVSIP